MRTNNLLIDALLDAADHNTTFPEVKAFIQWKLSYIYNYLEPRSNRSTRIRSSHYLAIRQVLDQWLHATPSERKTIRLTSLKRKKTKRRQHYVQ